MAQPPPARGGRASQRLVAPDADARSKGEHAGSRLARTLPVPVRGFTTRPKWAHGRVTDRPGARGPVSARKQQVRWHMAVSGQAVCKTVGLACVGSNPTQAKPTVL